MYRIVADVLPSQARALLRPESAIDQNGRDVAKQERVFWFDWNLAPLHRSDPGEGPLVRLDLGVTERLGCVEVRYFIGLGENRVAVRFAGNHPHSRECLFDFPPFDRKGKYAAQHLKLPIYTGDFSARIKAVACVGRDHLVRNAVERLISEAPVL
jgi:hypothetical protein